MFEVLLFSVFYDMFFLLPTLMQLALAYFFSGLVRRKSVVGSDEKVVAF